MQNAETMKAKLTGRLDQMRMALRARDLTDVPVTVLTIPRHGYATTRVHVENLYRSTQTKFVVFYVDVCSPPSVARYLEQQARTRPDFFHIRIDDWVSRQTARLIVLDLIATKFTVFCDNNMLFTPGWLESLLASAEADRADVVSPFIVMQGGNVHFSGSTLKKNPDGTISRRQNTPECRLSTPLASAKPRKMEIDFGESHCCLVATDAFRQIIPSIFPETMHNSHTLGFGTYLLKTDHGSKMIVEPAALVSILPIGFGYDIPWLFKVYNDLPAFVTSYSLYISKIGPGPSVTLANLSWHRKHLTYLLLTMLQDDHLRRTDMLEQHEVPDYVTGYDTSLPDDAEAAVAEKVLPFVREHFPEVLSDANIWVRNEMAKRVAALANAPVLATAQSSDAARVAG